jgi:hypothetical protein
MFNDMGDDSKTLTIFLIGGFIFLISLVWSIAWYNADKNKKIADSIATGANPVLVGCAYDNYPSNSSVCMATK